MRKIPDAAIKCAVFVGYMDTPTPEVQGFRPDGTAFVVSVPLPGEFETSALYFVTARHVIKGLPRKGLDSKIYLRLNLPDGKSSGIFSVEPDDWIFHPNDEAVDVAILPVEAAGLSKEPDRGEKQPALYIQPVQISNAATAEVIQAEGIGCGNIVFLTGLFINHYGKKRSLPIVRVGNIAMMPEEPIIDKGGHSIDAILIECRSIGGLSGSPVFVRIPDDFSPASWKIFWLGLMHGHWDGQLTDADAVGYKDERVNMGIAIVVPVDKILEVLNQPRLIAQREAVAARIRERNAPTLD